jgi:molybdopterin-guanine dinucleotide biosynthesis protein A
MPDSTSSTNPHASSPAGAVLAGGRSSRLGRDKALLEIRGETLLARAVRTLSSVCDEVIVVGPEERRAVVPAVRVVPDERPGIGPLGGIATALRATAAERLLVVATDMPLLNPDLLRYLLDLSHGSDVTIPRVDGRTQQLHAVYGRTCLDVIDDQLGHEDYKIDRFFARVRVRVVEEDEIRRIDPDLHSFRNINTEEDWHSVRSLPKA